VCEVTGNSHGGEGSFGGLLRRHREQAGLSQEALAVRAGLSIDAVSTLERGVRRSPRPSTRVRLADALGLRGSDREAFLAIGSQGPDEPPPEAPSGVTPGGGGRRLRWALAIAGAALILASLMGAGAALRARTGPPSGSAAAAATGRSGQTDPTGRPGEAAQRTVTIRLGPQHYIIVTTAMTSLVPNSTYPLGLFSAPCGIGNANLIDSFPGVDTDATGAATKPIYSREPLNAGIPAHTSLRMGQPVSPDTDFPNNASVGLLCADIQSPITLVNAPATLVMR
jgi:transcriptional regulator with XRE-family HTH domain